MRGIVANRFGEVAEGKLLADFADGASEALLHGVANRTALRQCGFDGLALNQSCVTCMGDG